MVKLQYSAANAFDLAELYENLRPRDVDEVRATSGDDVWGALSRALSASDDPVALRCPATGALIAIFGAAPFSLLSDVGSPWLLGTDVMDVYPKEILKDARRYIDFISERYPRQMNYVDARNEPSIRWLERIGFTIDPPVPYGVEGRPFHRFHKGFDNV